MLNILSDFMKCSCVEHGYNQVIKVNNIYLEPVNNTS